MELKGDIVKRFAMRGKFVLITRIEHEDKSFYAFRVTDKCNKKDYYSNEMYEDQQSCEKASMTICKAV